MSLTSERAGEPRCISLEQFARETGGTTSADVDSHIHAGLRCKPPTKTYDRWFKLKLAQLQQERDNTRAAFRLAIETGQIREPTNLERLYFTAKGHPDNPSTQAAQNVLRKRAERREAARADPGSCPPLE